MYLRTSSVVVRWFVAIFCALVLAAGCVGSLLLLYGGGSWQSAAQLEASNLAAVEVSELVGTPDYQSAAEPEDHSLLRTISSVFKLPLANPASMLSTQLPVLDDRADAQSSGSQASLFNSLSTWEQSSNKLAIGWAPYDTASRTIHLIQENPGISVISPKWMSVQNANGQIDDHVESDVVRYAHQHHVQVWAMCDNQFNASLTHSVLSQPANRQRLVQNIVHAAVAGKLDGVNIDFENVHAEDRTAFTQFIQSLASGLHTAHITLSADITPDIVFLKDDAAFFHAGLAESCDYVVLMAYDEHWGGDSEPGPVADVPWVESSVNDLLSTGVPADKLILGLPFYTRFWYVHRDGSVTSEAVAAPNIRDILAQHHAESQWNDTLGVAYAKYAKPDGYMEVWYETDKTMQRKLQLVNELGLPGVAIWSLSLSSTETWNSMLQALRQSVS
ncbi:hypothetical protein GCM10025857_37910 [Alicyclobacillus contaminans]|uniref:glycosyl hydrolase family 18 protein n=1 Tax=Alicyclobacillus contaminans TaxID=392016 RepID=UPI0003F803F8|nr:glycosyl hydrolase family 18 protein [Alicyclobacillus contaminans]GMA52434.1 hypothetical protein GCM10025857_37910 [Alicyclobacillus contaminans]